MRMSTMDLDYAIRFARHAKKRREVPDDKCLYQ